MNKLQKLSNDFLDSNFDSAIIISPHNRRYFTDFNSSIGYLFVTKDISYLLVDFRYIESAKKNAKNCNIILIDNLEKTLSDDIIIPPNGMYYIRNLNLNYINDSNIY